MAISQECRKVQNDKRSQGKKITKNWEKICANCGSTKNVEFHHIVPLANGGNDVEGNLIALCYDCHMKAHQKLHHNHYVKAGPKFKEIDSEILEAIHNGLCSANWASNFCDVDESTLRRRIVKNYGKYEKRNISRNKPTEQQINAYKNNEISFLELLDVIDFL